MKSERHIKRAIFCVTLILLSILQIHAQGFLVKGKIIDNEGNPVIGANIIIKNTQIGTTSNIDGDYSIAVQTANDILVISFVGYLREEIAVDSKTEINITLLPQLSSLNEVVVMGYSDKNKTEIASAVTVVSADKMKDVTTSSIGSMLQGKVAGVQIVDASGEPGAKAEVRIRGVSTLTGSSEPLYVVDGIIGGNYDPNDVESITVLKDAGATGMYGSQANAGVLIVTTKKGTSEKPRFEFSATGGFRTADFGHLKMMNSSQYYNSLKELFRDTTGYVDVVKFQSNYPKTLLKRDFDWVDAVFKPANIQNYYFSASGRAQKYQYYIGASYFDEDGTFMNTNYKKFNLRSNNTYTFSDRVNLTNNINLTYAKQQTYLQDNMMYAYLASPWDSAYNNNGSARYVDKTTSPWYSRDVINPIYQIQNSNYQTKSAEVDADITLNIKLFPWLNFTTTNRGTISGSISDTYLSPNIGGDYHDIGYINRNAPYSYGGITTNLLKLNKTFGEHSFSGLVGGEFQYSYNDYIEASGQGLLAGYNTLSTASSTFTVAGYDQTHVIKSFISQFNYNYKEKYFITGSYRGDKNSYFAPDHKSAAFPTVSASWLMSNEDFIKNLPFISFLKVRGSFGYTGNDNIDPGKYYALYSLTGKYNDATAAYPSQLPNSDLTWEHTRQMGLGAEFGLYKRINVVVDVYYNKTSNLLDQTEQALSIGYETKWENRGDDYNKGFEISVSTINIKTSNFNWTTDFNVSYNNNDVENVGDTRIRTLYGISQHTQDGYPLYSFFGPKWAGVDPSNGDPLWYAHGTTGDIKTNDYSQASSDYYLGTALPKFQGGLTTRWQYKGISLSMNFSFTQGNKVYNYDRVYFDKDGADPKLNQMVMVKGWKRWEKPGDIATHPRMTGSSTTSEYSSRFLEDGSFIRFRNINISYNIPKKIIGPKVEGLTITFSGDNLHTWTKYSGQDPEATLTSNSYTMAGVNVFKYPLNRQYIVSLKLKF
jgi:TonB-linked SusC/RagA family outer membrane protein